MVVIIGIIDNNSKYRCHALKCCRFSVTTCCPDRGINVIAQAPANIPPEIPNVHSKAITLNGKMGEWENGKIRNLKC